METSRTIWEKVYQLYYCKECNHVSGVQKAVKNVNETIAPALIAKGLDVKNQSEVDAFLLALDGTPNKGIQIIIIIITILI